LIISEKIWGQISKLDNATKETNGITHEKIASHFVRDLQQQILIYKTSRDFTFCRMSRPATDNLQILLRLRKRTELLPKLREQLEVEFRTLLGVKS